MRRAVASVVLSLGAGLLPSGTVLAGHTLVEQQTAPRPASHEAPAGVTADAPRPPAKRAVRAYGDGPLRVAPRQPGEITFRARRGDEVTLRVGNTCRGHLTLTDGRGVRREKLRHVFRVRSTGRATIGFRGACADPTRLQLTKLRGRKVPVDGAAVRLGKPQRGYLDVAWVDVPRTGRLKLTGRDARGRSIRTGELLVGDELRWYGWEGASFEHGQPVAVRDELGENDPVVRRGTRIGLTSPTRAWVDARSASTHVIELDGPPVTLPAGRGREHVLTVALLTGVSTFLDSEEEWWRQGSAIWLRPSPTVPARSGTYRLVVATDPDAAPQDRTLRVRSIREAPDLVLGGPPVRFESADPGQWFSARVPAERPASIQLAASDVTVTGSDWSAALSGPCYRDCPGGYTFVSAAAPVAAGQLQYREPYRVLVKLGHGASGGLTLTLSSRSRD